ncbi:MAG TPA: inositol monophosphatase family protein [Gaiellaceae bacterium]|nr:inositol monophosphatase family protein [Gaiellaceae bacterium]
MSYEAELALAREAAIAAGEIALRLQGSGAARRKADGTWVTDADEAVETELRRRIGDAFPEHGVLGEEQGPLPARPGAPTWILDPIDGTANYLAGIPIWAVLIGLRVDGASVLGVAHAPALGETYEAALGGGAFMNGRPIRAAPVARLEEASVLFGAAGSFVESGLEGFLAALVAQAARDRGLGDFWGHLLVARGAAHAMVEAAPLALWDVAPLEPILAEAGAVTSRPTGEPWSEGQPLLTSSDRVLHETIVKLLLGSERR